MRLGDYFEEKLVQSLDRILESLSLELDVSKSVLEDILISEALPCNDKRWPRTWLMGKHIDNVFANLDVEYILAFQIVQFKDVIEVINEWQDLRRVSGEKLKRMFERDKAFKLVPVYYRSRHLKDAFVLALYKLIKKISLRDLIRTAVSHVQDAKVNFSVRVVWKWNKYGSSIVSASNLKYKTKIMEVGE